MENSFVNSISVDCVVFGFDNDSLKVLLVERYNKDDNTFIDYKLPGRLIHNNEEIVDAAYGVLSEMTGLNRVYLKEVKTFSAPNRVNGLELEWINRYHGVSSTRVITVAYYSIIRINEHRISKVAHWEEIENIKHLALDHKNILMEALDLLTKEFAISPIAFDLLPKKFTLSQLRKLTSIVLGIEIDKRNFYKKLTSLEYIKATGERETNAAHRPAEYYIFDRKAYERDIKKKTKLNLINWTYK